MGANRSELGLGCVLSGDHLDQAAADDCHGERQKRELAATAITRYLGTVKV
jgi:hypothetical protein